MGAVVYAGGEADSVQVVSGTPLEVAGVGAATYTRCAIRCRVGDVIRCNFYDVGAGVSTTVDAGQTLFVHYQRNMTGAFTTSSHLMTVIRDSAGFPWVAIQNSGGSGNVLTLMGNTGSGGSPTWTAIGSGTSTFVNSGVYVDDILVQIDAGGTHTVEWAINQTRVTVGTFTNVDFTEAASFDLTGFPFAADIYFSQMMATEGLSTIGGHVYTSALSGAGNQNAWGTGTYTDINEVVLNDSSVMSTTGTGDVATFACTDITTPVNYTLPCVFVWTRGKNSGATPLNIETVFRISGTDYASADLPATGVAFGNQPVRYDQAPSGVDWSDAIFNAAERGVKSAA